MCDKVVQTMNLNHFLFFKLNFSRKLVYELDFEVWTPSVSRRKSCNYILSQFMLCICTPFLEFFFLILLY